MNPYVKLHDDLASLVHQSASVIVPQLIEWFHPQSVIDVGCGNGTWLAAFQQAGVSRIQGLDGDYIRPESLEIPRDCFRCENLDQTWSVTGSYDLAVCTEVAEHLSESPARKLVQQLTQLAPIVVFSAAIPGQGGVGHINEQWPSYWVHEFANQGYSVCDPLRPRLWNDKRVAYWYAQNLLIYCRSTELHWLPESIRQASPTMPMDVVHPTRLTAVTRELNYLRNPSMTSSFRQLMSGLQRRILRVRPA